MIVRKVLRSIKEFIENLFYVPRCPVCNGKNVKIDSYKIKKIINKRLTATDKARMVCFDCNKTFITDY